MSSPAPSPGQSTRPLWLLVGALLAVGIVVPLLVWLYDTESPSLWGFPFYYWFQFALIPVVSILTYLAFRISQVATARDREARGLPAHPGDETEGRR